MEDLLVRLSSVILIICLIIIIIKFYKEKDHIKKITSEEKKKNMDLISELESELKQQKHDNKSLQNTINLQKKDIENLNNFSKQIEEAFVKKKQEMNAKYEYLNDFLNNGVFYDKQNDSIVLISELIRVADLDEKEEVENESKDKES